MTASFRKRVKTGESCNLSDMYKRVIQSLGVPKEELQQYHKAFKESPEKLQHTHLIGVADPTSKLPPNSVFLTGTMASEFRLGQVFVSRSPCVETKDGRVLNVVRKKPNEMHDNEWEWLQGLTFGALVFANPWRGDCPLPELIAGVDLDGDLFFACWEKNHRATYTAYPHHT